MPILGPKGLTPSGKGERLLHGGGHVPSQIPESSSQRFVNQGPIRNRRSIFDNANTSPTVPQQEVATPSEGDGGRRIDGTPPVAAEPGPEDNEPIAGGRGNPHLGDKNREKTISKVFERIQTDIGSEQEVYQAFGTESREEIIVKSFRALYAVGLTTNEIGSEYGVSLSYVINQIPEEERREKGYRLRDERFRRMGIEKAHRPEANTKRGKSLHDWWEKVKEEDSETIKQKFDHLDRIRGIHSQKTEEKLVAAFGVKDIKKKLQAMVNQRMDDAAIAETTGLPPSTIKGVRKKYGIKLKSKGSGVTDEERKMAKEAINRGYSAKIGQRQLTVIFERLLCKPPIPLEAVSTELSISRERVRQIERAQLLKIKKFLQEEQVLPVDKGENQIIRRRGRQEKPVEDIPNSEYTRGNLMRLARKIYGVSLREVSEITGLTYHYICGVENGSIPASDHIAYIYEKLFKLKPGEIQSIPRTRVKKDNQITEGENDETN